jgi:arylsulfatase A-like enzyme
MRSKITGALLAFAALVSLNAAPAHAQDRPPNIVVIMPDDVGITNVSAYSHGLMGQTPNIDRLANEGMLFTDHYSHPTCTPGRAAFITGQMPIRTGLTTVGMAGSPIGLDARDPTLAELLKARGYATGQFGKNHLGDRNSHLPTVHGFDEYYGNLYHLNTDEEPFLPEWPKTPGFDERYRPRGVLDCKASDRDDRTDDGRFGPMGRQVCRDTGPLDPKRMETVDDEFRDRTIDFMRRAVQAEKPFFVWHNPSRMHIYTHVREAHRGRSFPVTGSGDSVYADGMLELDHDVGKILDELKALGVENNTIVIFTTDNGAMVDWYPDAGVTPFRGEKATTWEGGVRVPFLVRWPAAMPAGSVSNGIQTNEDVFTTLASAAGIKDVARTLRQRDNVIIDGVDNLAHWTRGEPSARNFVIYYNESEISAVRIGPWKSHIKARDGFFDWNEPSALLFNLRMDPFERQDGWKSREFAMKLGVAWGGQVQDVLGAHFRSLQEVSPRQAGGSLLAPTR